MASGVNIRMHRGHEAARYEATAFVLVPVGDLYRIWSAAGGRFPIDPSIDDEPRRIAVGVLLHKRAIYVSRPTERIYVRDRLVGWLPLEADHMPDGYEPSIVEALIEGSGVTRETLMAVLDVAQPAHIVDEFRDLIAKLEARGFETD